MAKNNTPKSTFDHSKVDPLDLDARRVHMEAFFKHLELWDETKVKKLREQAVEGLCVKLDTKNRLDVGLQYFEYSVDRIVWANIFHRAKKLPDKPEWPWSEVPDLQDMSDGTSPVYREWRIRNGKPVEEARDSAPATKPSSAEIGSEVEEKEQKLADSATNLKRAQTDIDNLQKDLNSKRVRIENEASSFASFEQRLRLVEAKLEKAVADQEAHQCLKIPEGVTGDLAKLYLRLADELRDVPSVPDTTGKVDLTQVAVELAYLVDGHNAKRNLLDFIETSPGGFYCLEQVIKGKSRPPVDDELVCPEHHDCVLAEVVCVGGKFALSFAKSK
ncbi:hypothetical protein F53441_8459 [Fusarium austroafricanum]|uniref:Uncharacterized protein n=1 Tax=Fusarium austroafricanum TaxID=2364996 RepID=A0A8H4P4L2_9HYPO|nr:hypothetical protein F53441_8459 [Fusarium austroafricanum]